MAPSGNTATASGTDGFFQIDVIANIGMPLDPGAYFEIYFFEDCDIINVVLSHFMPRASISSKTFLPKLYSRILAMQGFLHLAFESHREKVEFVTRKLEMLSRLSAGIYHSKRRGRGNASRSHPGLNEWNVERYAILNNHNIGGVKQLSD
jgi:hypothetical protein